MNYITSIGETVKYIENNLTNELDVNDLASKVYLSTFYFQKLFKLICGITISEYIRNRRLTEAAKELNKSNIIDIAYKYGYNSPDSFTKAFTKFHGQTPSQIKKTNLINLCLPLNIAKIIKGEFMNYKIINKEQFQLLGYKKRMNKDISSREKEIEEMWLSTRDKQERLLEYRNDMDINWYELTMSFNKQNCNHYISILTSELDNEFEQINIPPQTYAVFTTDKCPYPTEIYAELQKEILKKWPIDNYELIEGLIINVIHWYPDEVDKPKRYIEIWIPVKKTLE